jgi:hypothetical protein
MRRIKVVLLAVFLFPAAAFSIAQGNTPSAAPTSLALVDGTIPDALKAGSDAYEDAKMKLKQERYQNYAAIIALIGALASLLPKMLESASLVSRTKNDLQRIEDIASLIQKIQAENILTEDTMQSVKTQLEAEIMLAVNGLEKSRRRRLEKKTQHDDSGLSLQSRLFLLYRPLGFRAWFAHFCTYSMAILGLFLAYAVGTGEDGNFHWRTFFAEGGWLVLLSFLVMVSLLRMWALSERKRWLKMQMNPQSADLNLSPVRRLFLLYRPVGFRAWIAHFCVYSMVILGFLIGFTSLNFSLFLFYLFLAATFRMWALWERRRLGKSHLTSLSATTQADLG